MKLANLALVSITALAMAGCYGSSYRRGNTSGGMHDVALFATGIAAGALIASESSQPTMRYERPDDREYPVYRQAAPQPIYVIAREDGTLVIPERVEVATARAPAPPPPPPSFDALRARQELAQVELAKCRESGAPRGYGHAKVTFNPSGDISKVVIDEPAAMAGPAAKCIGDAIGKTTIPVFNGSLVTVGTTYFVP